MKAFVVTLGVIVGIAAIWAVSQVIRRAVAPVRGQTEAVERIQGDADYRIAVRQKFFDLCADVRAKEEQITNVRREIAHAQGDRKEQLRGAILALQNTRAELIEDYNAAASDQFTRGVFRDLSLPFQLSVQAKETQCAV